MSAPKLFDARREVVKYGRPFAAVFGKYEVQFHPHLLGSMVWVGSRDKDEFCGTWMLADVPPGFAVALGAAARKLNKVKS